MALARKVICSYVYSLPDYSRFAIEIGERIFSLACMSPCVVHLKAKEKLTRQAGLLLTHSKAFRTSVAG